MANSLVDSLPSKTITTQFDIDWVRAYEHHKEPAAEPEKPLEQQKIAV